MRIGVFDSGIGGAAVASSLQTAFPNADIMLVDDHNNVPYGTKTAADIIRLTDVAIQPLLAAKCDVIVIACNTATALAIEALRTKYVGKKFIGLEPMVKPAPGMSKTGVIAVCATPATLASPRYKRAKKLYASGVSVFEPDCSRWAELIESNEMNRTYIDAVAKECLDKNADVVILGCTHYHWIKDEMIAALGEGVTVLEPTDAIVRRVKELFKIL